MKEEILKSQREAIMRKEMSPIFTAAESPMIPSGTGPSLLSPTNNPLPPPSLTTSISATDIPSATLTGPVILPQTAKPGMINSIFGLFKSSKKKDDPANLKEIMLRITPKTDCARPDVGSLLNYEGADVELSLCRPQVQADPANAAALFSAGKVSVESFQEDPLKIINDKRLLVRVNDTLYSWNLIAPMLFSMLAFRKVKQHKKTSNKMC